MRIVHKNEQTRMPNETIISKETEKKETLTLAWGLLQEHLGVQRSDDNLLVKFRYFVTSSCFYKIPNPHVLRAVCIIILHNAHFQST